MHRKHASSQGGRPHMYVPSRSLREQLHDALEKANEIVMKMKRTLWSSILFLIALNFWLNYQYRQPHHHTFQFLWNNNCKTRPAIQISVFFTPPSPKEVNINGKILVTQSLCIILCTIRLCDELWLVEG